VKDKIAKTLEEIEKEEGVWEQNENWEQNKPSPDWGLKTKFASIPRSTGKYIYEMILERKPKVIFEIGSSVGYSTLWMAMAAEQIGAKIYATEINTGRIELAKKHFKEAGVDNIITLYEQDAHQILQQWGQREKLDFVFLDAFKKDYAGYFDLVYPIMNQGGIIVIDNVSTHANLLGEFFDKIRTNNKIKKELINKDNGIMTLFT
jgi:predicted O-methyltransferase YrrM